MNTTQAAAAFSADEIAAAQNALDLYPDASPFWDAAQGQEVLYIARACKLVAKGTNRDRIARYAKFKSRMRCAA